MTYKDFDGFLDAIGPMTHPTTAYYSTPEGRVSVKVVRIEDRNAIIIVNGLEMSIKRNELEPPFGGYSMK